MSKTISPLIKSLLFSVVLLPGVSLAGGSIGDAAQNLMGPTSIVMKLVEIFCYLIGLAFVMMSIAQYKTHRQSPKLVPLGTPITLLILGVIALLIPYTTKMAETGKSEVKEETKASALPLPGQDQKGTAYPPGPGQQQQQQEQQQHQEQPTTEQAPAPSDGTGGGGGWTSDPRYNR